MYPHTLHVVQKAINFLDVEQTSYKSIRTKTGKNKNYTNPKSDRNSGLFCTSRTGIHLNGSIHIMPSYLSIASNIRFNHQCLEPEETANFVEVRCLKQAICMVIYL